MSEEATAGPYVLMVVESGKLKGIIAQKDIMGYLSIQMEIEG